MTPIFPRGHYTSSAASWEFTLGDRSALANVQWCIRKVSPLYCSANVNSEKMWKCSHTCHKALTACFTCQDVHLRTPQKGLDYRMKHNFHPIGKYVFQGDERGCASDCQSIGIYFTVSQLHMTEIVWKNFWYSLWKGGTKMCDFFCNQFY